MAEEILNQELELFKETMVEDNLPLQVDLVRRLESLARVLGEKTTREDLLPFIEQNIDLHDEILYNLSEQLKNFIPLVGGLEHSKIVFDILRKLCVTDEVLVRERAIETLKSFAKEMNSEQVEELLYPVLNTLVGDDWFTSKCSAVTLYPACYSKLTDARKEELRSRFRALIQDDSPMVRRAAALACIDFVACLETDYVKNEFIPIFSDIAQDPMDTVRSITIEIAMELSKILTEDEIDKSVFKIIEQASDDTSWRLRQRLASNIAEIQEKIPHPKHRGKLIQIFQKLTQDCECEVRMLVANNVFDYCKGLLNSYSKIPQYENNFEPVFEQSIMPAITRLFNDEAECVRLALSSSILPLGSILGESGFKMNIVPLLMAMLEKEESMAIQANFLQGLGNLSSDVDLTPLLGAIKSSIRAVILRSHSNWRNRRSVLTALVDLSRFCTDQYFSNHFKIYYASLLSDSIFAIRRSASLILPILSKRYGIRWASDNLVPYFSGLTSDTKYLYRYVPLFGISEMIKPSLCIRTEAYLNGFKKFVENKDDTNQYKACSALVKIILLVDKIEIELEEKPYKNMLKLIGELNYSDIDSFMYSETCFDNIKENYDAYSVEEKDFADNRKTYLEGILFLILNKFLGIIKILNDDVTENIQVRAIFTLAELSRFVKRLKEEISEAWIQESLKRFPPEETNKIKEEIETELRKQEEIDEKSLFSFSRNISTESSNNVPDLVLDALHAESDEFKEI